MAKKFDKVNSVEALEAKLVEVREAEAVFSKFTQEQVDAICLAAGRAANQARIPLAKMANAETGIGIVEDKVIKNNYAAEHISYYFRNKKTCGVIEENKVAGTMRVAEPLGVIGAIIPTTNPTSTTIYKILMALKTRNAIIVSPHPNAKNCTIEAARIMKEAAVAAGLPENVIAWVDEPSLDISAVLMKGVDFILATGGEAMVHAAYASGTPAIGVGPGNCNVIMDSTCDIKHAVNSIILSKTFDNGVICASEQHLSVVESIYNDVKKEFQNSRCYFLNADEAKKVADVFFNPATHGVKANAVGRSAIKLAEMAGIKVPADTKVLIAETSDTSHDNAWANEKLCPVLGMFKVKDFDEALKVCDKLVNEGGAGHTAALHIDPTERAKIEKFGATIKAGRLIVNIPSAHGGLGDLYNFDTPPSLTLGPGSFGGSTFMGQTNIEQLLNIKIVSERRENMLWLRVPERVYFKKGGTSVALTDLKTDYNCKRAFIVTDANIFNLGICQPVIDRLEELGMSTTSFSDIEVDPKIQDVLKGMPSMDSFAPDVIVAIGGGSAIDTAKMMWLLYEAPEYRERWLDLATVFIDIRKRVEPFPKCGKKAKLVCIPTTAGTGSEVTPFTIISDAETGYKWPIADYEILPTMAIVDADFMMNMPPSVTRASGYDVLTHAVEAYVGVFSTDYTRGMALTAIKSVFEYLPRAYKNGANDEEARIKMADASCLAGIAFANSFLGINHSLAHKLGGYHHLPHGVANAVMFTAICEYNAQKAPTKMGIFSQYKYPQAFERYVEIAEYCGFKGKDDEETFANFIKKATELKAAIDVPMSIKDYGIKEEDFMATLDEMVENAFNDQCTGGNPVYPLFTEIRELYLKAYWGAEYETKVKAAK